MKKFTALLLAMAIMISLAAVPAKALTSLDNFVSGRFSKVLPVYSGPGKDYYRANNGKASYGGAGAVRIYGVVDGWVLMGYGLSNGDYRIGYVEGSALDTATGLKGAVNTNLKLSDRVMYTTENVNITDDPIVKCTRVEVIPANTEVIALGIMDGKWAYVEVMSQTGKKMRGFVGYGSLVDKDGYRPPVPTATPYVPPTARPTATAMPYYPTITQSPYYPQVTQAPVYTGNSLLSSLTHNCPNTGIMLPTYFSPYQTTYLLTVADWVSKPTFTPVSYDPNAVITVNGEVVRSGQTSRAISMTDKPQAVTITVRSGNATTTYTIYLQRRPSEKRTRVSAGYITNIYTKNNQWRMVADLGTISYLGSDYNTGSRSNFENKTADTYDYVVSPNCMFYYGTPQNPIRLSTVSEFMTYYRVYGSNLYTIIYIEDEIVAVFPYGAERMIY